MKKLDLEAVRDTQLLLIVPGMRSIGSSTESMSPDSHSGNNSVQDCEQLRISAPLFRMRRENSREERTEQERREERSYSTFVQLYEEAGKHTDGRVDTHAPLDS